VSPIAASI